MAQDKQPDKSGKLADQATIVLSPIQSKLNEILLSVAEQFQLPSACIGQTRKVLAVKKAAVLVAVELLCPPVQHETVATLLTIPKSTFYRLLAGARDLEKTNPEWRQNLFQVRERLKRFAIKP